MKPGKSSRPASPLLDSADRETSTLRARAFFYEIDSYSCTFDFSLGGEASASFSVSDTER